MKLFVGAFSVLTALCFFSCTKEELQPTLQETPSPKFLPPLSFSGYEWKIKNSGNSRVGPGGNFFSNKSDVVFLDGDGNLHLKILKKGNKWLCSEIYSNMNFGYGKYVYVTKGNVESYDKKIVMGLFTWDDNDFQTQANSELDIEFAKWGVANAPFEMEYSVQPTYGPGFFPERTNIPSSPLIYDAQGYTTHVIDWNETRVKFETHTGDDTSVATRTHLWIFDDTNPPRKAYDGSQFSDPIVIPAPGATTKAHINFWLFDSNGNGKGDAPSNGQNAELVVHRFQYVPY